MLSQDIVYQPSMIEAKIQSYIAKFLGEKEKLLVLQSNPNPNVSSVAKNLMSTQLQLEGQLPGMLSKAKSITAGSYTFPDLFAVYSFASELNKHVNNVENLQKQATIMPLQSIREDLIFGLPKSTIYTLGGVVAIGIIALYVWKK